VRPAASPSASRAAASASALSPAAGVHLAVLAAWALAGLALLAVARFRPPALAAA
jgi:hypothetical protein